jgi:hypothetical protein
MKEGVKERSLDLSKPEPDDLAARAWSLGTL